MSLPAIIPYPERTARSETSWLARVFGLPAAWFDRITQSHRYKRLVGAVSEVEASLQPLTDDELSARVQEVRSRLRRAIDDRATLAQTFALIRETGRRTLGLRHRDVQLRAGLAMLDSRIIEMQTGEGKTLAATLAACVAAMKGWPVHVVTTNDYLAARDAKWMGPLYESLGLSVGLVTHDDGPDERRRAYARDVCYVSNKELGFDYLRDKLVEGRRRPVGAQKIRDLMTMDRPGARRVLRGLCFAIVDEADSVLIDEARTPLLISNLTDPAEEAIWAADALNLIRSFEQDEHYVLLPEQRRVELTDAGRELLVQIAEEMGGLWRSAPHREHAARQALAGLHLYKRDDHYVVQDGKIVIVDEYTGRLSPDRSWSDGLHQIIELKEQCQVSPRKEPLGRLTYQRLFRSYEHVCGMTGTGREVAGEFREVYGLRLQTIPPHQPCRRIRLAPRVFASNDEKVEELTDAVRQVINQQRAVLIGTRSIAASLRVSEHLESAGVEHAILNATQDADEAGIIAQAGQPGRVTVATNMAGRGVDIRLHESVSANGGLHVIVSECHDARRIDRQLVGRAARQGDPGSYQLLLSLEDGLLELLGDGPAGQLARHGAASQWVRLGLIRWAQLKSERATRRACRAVMAQDQRHRILLAFSGGTE